MKLPPLDLVVLHLSSDSHHVGAAIPVVLSPDELLNALTATPYPGRPDDLSCQGVIALEYRAVQSLGSDHLTRVFEVLSQKKIQKN